MRGVKLSYSQFSHKTMYLDANWQSIDILSEIASIWNGNGHNFEIGKVFCILWNNQNSLALVIIFGKVLSLIIASAINVLKEVMIWMIDIL